MEVLDQIISSLRDIVEQLTAIVAEHTAAEEKAAKEDAAKKRQDEDYNTRLEAAIKILRGEN